MFRVTEDLLTYTYEKKKKKIQPNQQLRGGKLCISQCECHTRKRFFLKRFETSDALYIIICGYKDFGTKYTITRV